MTTPLNLARNALTALTALNAVGDRVPTALEAAELALWPGWGPLAPALTPNTVGAWTKIADELDELVPAAALDKARDIVDTSFYTTPAVVDAVYTLLRATGFTAGRILEPGCGSGNFMVRTPGDLAIDWTGVEIDPTAARFARAMNPDAEIIGKPLEKTSFRTGSYDAVIGNVPFSSATVFDPAFPSANLHEYFTVRALDAVRPGCYVIIVTSRYMIDGDNGLNRVRETADLISALRLPTATFDGTDVVADILVLRKRADGEAVSGWTQPTEEYNTYSSWNRVAVRNARLTVTTGDHEAVVNGLWAEHLDCVAGALTATSFFKSPLAVLADDPDAAIRAATAAAAAHIEPADMVSAAHDPFTGIILEDVDGRKTGSFHIVDGLVLQIVNGTPVMASSQSAELRALIQLRDAATELIALESHPDRPDHQIEPARVIARDLYTAYTAVYGPLNRGNLIVGKPDPETGEPALSWRRPLMGGFRRDPDNVSVMALEQFDQETGEARPAPILLRRVGAHPPRATSAASAEEALAISLGETGTVNVRRIAELINVDESAVLAELGDLVYRDPEARGALTIARDYLSGDVRTRLANAQLASETDPEYWRNTQALEAVVPALLGPLDIRAQLGATWITADDVQAFTRETFGRSVRIEFTSAVALWEVDTRSAYADPAARIEYGTTRMSPYDLVSCALNGKTPLVTDDVFKPATGKMGKAKNHAETLAAEEKLRAIQDRFSIWIWEDEARSTRLITEYNRRFNSHVIRRGDGSYLTFPGLDENINLWSWQRDAVDRIISTNKVLIGHPVGSGKTKSMIAGAMTLRRMGLARKPLIIVPNHLLEQIAREAQQAYPTGRFLIASKDDLCAENRRLFAARCATGEWDAVVITHQAFTSIGVDADTESDWLQEQKSDLRVHMQDTSGGRRGAKAVATAVRKLEERVSELRYGVRDENQITFEQLGVDHISVDEAHMFRRLQISTRAEGFSLGSSKRATDLLLKVDTLGLRYPGKPVAAFFTGTPWSNTLAETYVWQRFLQPERLIEAGVEQFDAWAATFVRYESKVEVTPDGQGFRMYRRPSVIQNVPELRLMLGAVADLLTAESIGLERPDAVWTNVVSEPGDEQREFVENLAVRADAIRTPGMKPQRPGGGDDNMLVVCNDGRLAALDPRLVGLDEDSSKVEDAAQRISGHYHAGKDRVYGASTSPGSFQLVLCDIGTPRPGDTQVYGRLRTRLIELGLPAERIRFVHEAKTDKARDFQFAQARDGKLSVLIGSTSKVGVGTNIQTRLEAVHHLDAPWRPSDIEQREGRALRPGNLNELVHIYRYVTERSFDSFMWQTLERKQRFISQMFVADGTIRELEDIGDAVLNFAEVKAIAAGNPELLRQAELASEVRRLRTVRAVWIQTVNRLRREAKDNRAEAERFVYRATADEKASAATDGSSAPADASAYDSIAKVIKAESGWASGTYRGLDIRLAQKPYGQQSNERVLEVSHNYYRVTDIQIGRGEARKTVTDLADLILAKLDAWWADLDTTAVRLRKAAAVRVDAANAAEAAADKSVFTHGTALTEAEHELEQIERTIAESVEDRLADAA